MQTRKAQRFFPAAKGAFLPILIALILLALAAAGCGKRQNPDPTVELTRSFREVDAATIKEVDQASRALKEKNYLAAMVVLNRLVEQGRLNSQQRKAIGDAVGLTLKAIERDPSIENPALYHAMDQLLKKTMGEN